MERLPISHIPDELSQALREVGKHWAESDLRPRLDHQTKEHWDKLVNDWAESDLPLAIRKSGGIRGELIFHSSGRKLVLADNSPAHWAFSRAYGGSNYSLSEVEAFLGRDLIPFAYATTASEKNKMAFKCTLSVVDNVNKSGWKLCHSHPIGLKTKVRVEDISIELLKQHFCSLLMPSNHFLVPLTLGGIGEVTEIIDEVRRTDNYYL